jgi:hypothetical protein
MKLAFRISIDVNINDPNGAKLIGISTPNKVNIWDCDTMESIVIHPKTTLEK